MISGAEIMVKCLQNEGVSYLFGYPGAAICPFYDYITKTDIKHVLVRQEQNAAHMANGYARASGKPGVCVATSGPGATNLITGIATAYMDSIQMCIRDRLQGYAAHGVNGSFYSTGIHPDIAIHSQTKILLNQ